LVEIRAATVDNAPLNEFNLNVNISRPKEESASRPKPGAPAAAPSAPKT
jgi:hypothetical protein